MKNADPKQIEAISHNPSFAFNVKEFSQLNTVQERLKNYVNLPDQELKVFLEKGKNILDLYFAVAFYMLVLYLFIYLFVLWCAVLCF